LKEIDKKRVRAAHLKPPVLKPYKTIDLKKQ